MFEPGSDVGRYRMVSLLGQGGMGSVYDALDPALGRHVALKILPAEATKDAKRLSRFVQEARSASALNHPHIVAIYEIGEHHTADTAVHFIAMEKIDGLTLRDLLASERLSLEHLLELFSQIAGATAAAHGAGVVHRDLKPENIMISRDGYAKVLDFGLAKLHPDVAFAADAAASTFLKPTEPGTVMGTVGYMSPEQAQGKLVDHRSDIFSLGCILFEMVTGRRAFRGETPIDTLHQVLHADPPSLNEFLPDAPAELQRIVRKAMAKDPESRYQSAKDMTIDVRQLLRGIDTPRTADGGRRSGFSTVLLFVVVSVAVLAIWWYLRRPPAAAPPSPLSIQRVTARGDVIHAVISPDGKYVSYSLADGSLRLRQLATGQELELVPPSSWGIWGETFTPDGNAIAYVLKDSEHQIGSLYRIAAIGGQPEHLLDGMDSPPGFSPDGKRITWVRAEFPRPGESALMIANSDGTEARPIATRRLPERFAPILFTGPSWSADGTLIATSVQRSADPPACKLIVVDPNSGHEHTVLDAGWPLIGQSVWLPNGSGIITAAATGMSQLQLWLITYPGGIPRRITNDVSLYRSVSITADGKSLLSVNWDSSAQVWSAPLAGGAPPQKISGGKFDDLRGLSFTADGHIVFASIEEKNHSLYLMNANGSGKMRLTRDGFNNVFPAPFRDGVAYVSMRLEGNEIRFTTFGGEMRRVIVRGADAAPIAVSPDGKSLVFQRNRRLWRVPMSGGTPAPFVREISSSPQWSPSGDRIAFFYGDPDEYAASGAVIAASNGRLLWHAALSGVHIGSTIRWLHDGNALLINSGPADPNNIWMYPFNGKPRRLTSFGEGHANFWDLSPDGTRFAISKVTNSRDAVLISGFR